MKAPHEYARGNPNNAAKLEQSLAERKERIAIVKNDIETLRAVTKEAEANGQDRFSGTTADSRQPPLASPRGYNAQSRG